MNESPRTEWPMCRGVRGATTTPDDSRRSVLLATGELLLILVQQNDIDPDDLASVIFTTTTDLTSEYPALAARKLGWLDVPLLCGHEMAVPHGLPRCIRVLLHWNTFKAANQIEHVYIRGAEGLRPDQQNLQDIPEVAKVPFDLD